MVAHLNATIFLISLLINIENPKRRWILGISFILASGAVYYAFLAAWLNFFLVVGMISWIRLLIGVFALFFGAKSIKDYLTDTDPGCVAEEAEKRNKIFTKIKKLVVEKNILLSVIGISSLAIAVNLVELVCSAGLPAIYTQVLSMSELPTITYYSYLLFYIIIFMIDDLAVFILAMVTLKMVGVQKKYLKTVRLIGGGLMLVLGLILILKPELLMFG